tara:strand:- start:26184 stop:26771 length:588 start_codon:yes stop_codon:yes gene_type:complete
MSRDIEEKYDGPGYVYIVRQIGTNFYKIGFTRFHPDRRFKELKIGSPRGLKVETFFEGSMEDEHVLHEAFSRFSREGEWFELDKRNLFAVAVDTALSSERFPKKALDISAMVKCFIVENFKIKKEMPKNEYDGFVLEDLYDLFAEWCRQKDYSVPDQEIFKRSIDVYSFKRLYSGGKTILPIYLKSSSILIEADY